MVSCRQLFESNCVALDIAIAMIQRADSTERWHVDTSDIVVYDSFSPYRDY